MLKLRIWAASLAALALLFPGNAWSATVVKISFGAGTCSGSAAGSTLELDQDGAACAVDVIMTHAVDVLDITAFNIFLTGTNLDMVAFTFDQTLIGSGSGVSPTFASINAAAKPISGVRIGFLELTPSILGGQITLGGAWTDNGPFFGATHPFDHAGTVMAVVVPEPSSVSLVLIGILGLAGRRHARPE